MQIVRCLCGGISRSVLFARREVEQKELGMIYIFSEWLVESGPSCNIKQTRRMWWLCYKLNSVKHRRRLSVENPALSPLTGRFATRNPHPPRICLVNTHSIERIESALIFKLIPITERMWTLNDDDDVLASRGSTSPLLFLLQVTFEHEHDQGDLQIIIKSLLAVRRKYIVFILHMFKRNA